MYPSIYLFTCLYSCHSAVSSLPKRSSNSQRLGGQSKRDVVFCRAPWLSAAVVHSKCSFRGFLFCILHVASISYVRVKSLGIDR